MYDIVRISNTFGHKVDFREQENLMQNDAKNDSVYTDDSYCNNQTLFVFMIISSTFVVIKNQVNFYKLKILLSNNI